MTYINIQEMTTEKSFDLFENGHILNSYEIYAVKFGIVNETNILFNET